MTGAVLDRPAPRFAEAWPGPSSGGGVTLEELFNAALQRRDERQRRVPRVPRAHDIHARGHGGEVAAVRRLRQPPQLGLSFQRARSAVANSRSATSSIDRPLPV